MSSSRISENDVNAHDEEVGAGITTELWWRDRYDEILKHGYELRPRCHPKWLPSCIKSTVDGSQAHIVRLSAIVFFFSAYGNV